MSDFKPGDRVTVVIPIFKGIGIVVEGNPAEDWQDWPDSTPQDEGWNVCVVIDGKRYWFAEGELEHNRAKSDDPS
jgi:hypothetical protein